MKITKKSPISGKENTREIAVTEQQINLWKSGELIQKAMPDLSPEDREFILSGITPEEWNEMFSDEDEDDVE